jgi:hypothetical protein
MDVDQLLADLTPVHRSMVSEAEVSTNELEVVNFAEKLFDEGRAWQKTLGIERIFSNALDALATKHFIEKRERTDRVQIAVNYFRHIIEQKLSQQTDAAPIFEVSSRSGRDWSADIAEDVMGAWWEEYSGQTFLDRIVLQSMLGGSAPAFATWDKTLDGWSGDIRMQCLPSRQVVFDPYLSEARLLQSDAMFVGVEMVKPLAEARLYYKEAGQRVRPEPGISHFGGSSDYNTGGIGTPYRRAANRNANWASSAIPRYTERRVYFRDLTLRPDKPEKDDGTPNFLFPRKRCIIWSAADKVLLSDGDGVNWDGKYPLELNDWGMQLEHAYGESEYESLWPMQVATNLIYSGLVHNARLHNEPPWMAEENSIDPIEVDHWERYSDHPSQFHFYKAGFKPPMPLSPQAYPNVVADTLHMLLAGMQLIGSSPPVSRGQTEPGVTAGKAIDSLQAAASVTTRRSSRRLEEFLSRYGQLVLSRIIQYFSNDRVLYLTKHPSTQAVLQEREAFIQQLVEATTEEKMEELLLFANRDLKLKVKPKSALGISQVEEVLFTERQVQAGRMAPVEVLNAARVSDPDQKIEEAKVEQAKDAMRMGQIRAILGGMMPQPGQNGEGPRQKGQSRALPAPPQGANGAVQ